MRLRHASTRRFLDRSSACAAATAALLVGLAVAPEPLYPIARAYRDLCIRFPVLAQVTGHLPPTSAALLIILFALAAANGARVGGGGLIRARRGMCGLRPSIGPLPPRLVLERDRLGLADRLVFLDVRDVMAFCHGMRRPCIVVTAGLLDRLDDEELAAVLAHERHHVRRRDPARYVLLYALTGAGFMFPVAGAIRRKVQTRIELAADRAALGVAQPGALAGALLAVLAASPAGIDGTAGLSPTEARIAYLAGEAPPLPIARGPVVATAALTVVIAIAVGNLAGSAHLVLMVCRFCARAM